MPGVRHALIGIPARLLALRANLAQISMQMHSLGTNLRTARLRRNLTIEDVAQKIGTGPRAVSDVEKGKISTSIAVYTALLWAYDLLLPMEELAWLIQWLRFIVGRSRCAAG
jgi:DNA-binding XRE family transcriptional regulator